MNKINVKNILEENKLELYVKDIFVLKSKNETKKHLLPFFADGYPGIVFCESCNGVFRYPQNKKLWNALHHLRTYAAILSFLLTIISLIKKA